MRATIKRTHRQLDQIITSSVESTDAKVFSIRFTAIYGDEGIELRCELKVITAQKDMVNLVLHHQELVEMINRSLRKQGYQTLSGQMWFENDNQPAVREGELNNPTCNIWIELEPSVRN